MAEQTVEAPLAGKVIRVHVQDGNLVTEGDRVCILEALKLEIPILAPVSGKVKAIHIAPGQQVEEGALLVVIEC